MELWDVLDKNRKHQGRSHIRGQAMAEGDYHLVVLVCVVDSQGRMLLTKRHSEKAYPNLWECTGGSVVAGEGSLEGAVREVAEETGLLVDPQHGQLINSYMDEDSHYDVWLFRQDLDISKATLQDTEVSDIRMAQRAEIDRLIAQDLVVPTLVKTLKIPVMQELVR